MNVAIVIPTIKAGGAEKQAVFLAKCLSANHNVYFFVFMGHLPKEQKHIQTLEECGVKIISLNGCIIKKTCYLARELKAHHIEAAFNFLTLCDGAGCFAEKRAGVRLIYNGIRSSRLPRWKMAIERFANNHWVTGTIFNSFCGADYFKNKGFDNHKFIIIQNCFPKIDTFFKRNENIIKTIITVGRFDPAKDYETSIKAIADVHKRMQNIKYRIVGHGGLEKQIRYWIKKYKISDVTEVLINPSNIPALLKEADVFLITSLYEGTSNAIMEALNASLPVVCTNVGDNAYLIKHNSNGYIHNVGDFHQISESLLRLLGDYEMRLSFGKNANQNLRDSFSLKHFNQQYSSLLEKK